MAPPTIIFGTGSSHMKSGEAAQQLSAPIIERFKAALASGYRYLDAGEVYTTEAELGAAISQSKIPRSELFVSSKVFDPSGDIKGSFARTLGLLQLDYLDQYMLHQPFTAASPAVLQKAWATLEELQREGKAKSIGVCNFSQAQIESLLETATIPPAVNQTEYHPYLQRGNLKAFLDSKNIKLEAFGPLTPIVEGSGRPGPLDGTLAELAKKYNVGEAEILLSWSLAQGASPVMTSTQEARIQSARKALDVKLTPDEVKEISQTGTKKDVRRWWGDFYPKGDYN